MEFCEKITAVYKNTRCQIRTTPGYSYVFRELVELSMDQALLLVLLSFVKLQIFC
jgi:hypothetical protein